MKNTTTVTKGQIFSLTVAWPDEFVESMRNSPELADKAVSVGADYWHTKILPEHFKSSAHGRYGYAQRSHNYLKSKHGKPDLVASGSMRRDLLANASFKRTANGIEMRMFARALNFAPNMPENSFEPRINHTGKRRKSSYPNLKREIKAVTDVDREMVAAVIARQLEIFFGNNEGRESDD